MNRDLAYESLEKELDLFSIEVDQVPIWERVRFKVFRDIAQEAGEGQAHTQTGNGLKEHLQGISCWFKNAIYRNPYISGEHDFLFYGHQRRKLEQDGFWWDVYCDPIHQRDKLEYIHVEMPYHMSHRIPAKTENIRYLDFIRYTGTLQRRLGLRSASIPDEVISHLQEAEEEIRRTFDVDLDLVSEARQALHVRNTTLPLYRRLLERIDPDVVVIAVSYGKETFIEACKRRGVPVVELQHGIIHDHHFGYSYPEGETKATFPDYLLTFGEFWNENARYPIPDDHVIPVGYPYLEERVNRYDNVDCSKQLLFISQGTIGHELSRFALEVHKDNRIDHKVVYKLHPGEYDRWEDEYPWLAESDVRVIDESKPPLYQLFAESTAQIGVGSTAVYEGLCFNLNTIVFDADSANLLKPLVEAGAASIVEGVDEIAQILESVTTDQISHKQFFKSNSVENMLVTLKKIQYAHNK